jgi:hypothetical protein
VELHGGSVAAANRTAGTGAVFTVKLPRVSVASPSRCNPPSWRPSSRAWPTRSCEAARPPLGPLALPALRRHARRPCVQCRPGEAGGAGKPTVLRKRNASSPLRTRHPYTVGRLLPREEPRR